jgi:hypothetical protein
VAEGGELTGRHLRETGGVTQGPSSTGLLPCGGGGADPAKIGKTTGTYFSSTWSGTSKSRSDPTLNLPFGGRHGVLNKPYDIPLPGASPNNSRPLKTAKWVGQIKAEKDGAYIFHVNVDNNGWVFVNGKQIVEARQGNGWKHYVPSSPVKLKAGQWVDFEVRFEELHAGSPSWIRIQWSSDSMKQTDIPASCLKLN